MKNETIEIVLNQLIENSKQLTKSIDGLKSKEEHNQTSEYKNKVKNANTRLNSIEEHQAAINGNLTRLANTIYNIDKTIKGYAPVNTTEKTVTHVFFPGILAWIESFYEMRVIWILLIGLVTSIIGNTYLYKVKEKLMPGYYKYYGALIYRNNIYEFEKIYDANPTSFQSKIDSVLSRSKKIQHIKSELKSIDIRKNDLDSTLHVFESQ